MYQDISCLNMDKLFQISFSCSGLLHSGLIFVVAVFLSVFLLNLFYCEKKGAMDSFWKNWWLSFIYV